MKINEAINNTLLKKETSNNADYYLKRRRVNT